MRKAYFGSRLSENLIKTPEGYLICKNVPIARIGVQHYMGAEFGAQDASRTYKVNRPAEEVFNKAAIASFEGKPVCDDHPPEDVTPENYKRYMKGVCRDVRKGEGDFANFLMADLIIYDAGLIREIDEGKREISCGYDCVWNPTGEDSYDQLEIRGNHIAVVDKGRAGHKAAIRDAEIKEKEKRPMKKSSILGRMLAVFAKDADTTPEDILEASKIANNDSLEGEPPAPPARPAPAAEPEPEPKPTIDAELDARLKRIEDALAALAPKQAEPEPEPDALDELEGELAKGETEPEPEEDPACDEGDVIEPEEDPEEEVQAARDAALGYIKSMKPILAKLPEAERRKASDSIALLIRGNIGGNGQYAQLQAIQRKAKDSAITASDADYGRMIRDKYNPHYMKK